MRAFLALVLFVVALPALAQVVIRVPVPVPPHHPYPPHYPFPGDPWRDPWHRPLPDNGCFGSRYDEAAAQTRALATERLERFAIEKGVNCSLTKSGLDFAEGNCSEVSGERFARLRMSFSVNCIARTPTSQLRKTTIKYY